MASDFRPTGTIVPLVTPFGEDGEIDLAALETLAGEVLDEGARGVVALATTGEPTSLNEEERDAVVAACARSAPIERRRWWLARGPTTPARRSSATKRSPTCPAPTPRLP